MKDDELDLKKYFDNSPLTRGEVLIILLSLFIAVLIIIAWFNTSCSLDCSMCPDTSSILKQSGFGG